MTLLENTINKIYKSDESAVKKRMEKDRQFNKAYRKSGTD